MIRKERKDKMFFLVEQWEQSGQSQRSFAMANGMKLYTLRYWVKKYRSKEQAAGGFVQLNGPCSTNLLIRYPNGIELHVPLSTPVSLLKCLIRM
ncbi:MAG: hypothetical protein IPM52_03860 [Bacteroidetes bacterium]|nr:hypothetical protein [Bacteroidota bacterium]